ncbi:MAG: nickel-responsive transcriptional regulator NikR [Candidatus Methanosuratincola sp.]|jgi:CopG family nickel-responsive transcriptional regulator|nr:nickel-responsive transcriptional regulator NikR [Candidatus Methanosuratincola sp.]
MEEKKGVERFSISVEPDLVSEFDSIVERLKLNRSKAIQQAMRLFLSEHYWSEIKGESAGAIVVVFDHSIRLAEDELTELQHSFREVINSVLHIHIDERNCLEIIAVRGKAGKVKELTEALEKSKGVKQIRYTIVAIE